MKIISNFANAWFPKTYTKLKSLSFAPEAALIGNQIPINTITAEIITDDEVGADTIGADFKLTDDMDTQFADGYYVTAAKRIDAETLRITAKSSIVDFDNVTAPFIVHLEPSGSRCTFRQAFEELLVCLPYGTPTYYIDSLVANREVYGVFREESARDRLARLCMASHAYVSTFEQTGIRIYVSPYHHFDDSPSWPPTHIPKDVTFYKPRLDANQPVKSVIFKTNSYVNYETDDYIESPDGVKYYYLPNTDERENEDIDPEYTHWSNSVTVESTINIPGDTKGDITTHYFNADTAEVDIINNGEYWPGEKVSFYADDGNRYMGIVSSANFSFGMQARSKLRIESVVPYNPT